MMDEMAPGKADTPVFRHFHSRTAGFSRQVVLFGAKKRLMDD